MADPVEPAAAAAAVTLHLRVDDPGKWWALAVPAGAAVAMRISDQFRADRCGRLTDPFGHSWSLGSPITTPVA